MPKTTTMPVQAPYGQLYGEDDVDGDDDNDAYDVNGVDGYDVDDGVNIILKLFQHSSWIPEILYTVPQYV